MTRSVKGEMEHYGNLRKAFRANPILFDKWTGHYYPIDLPFIIIKHKDPKNVIRLKYLILEQFCVILICFV